jgi:hypothetical protein
VVRLTGWAAEPPPLPMLLPCPELQIGDTNTTLAAAYATCRAATETAQAHLRAVGDWIAAERAAHAAIGGDIGQGQD